MVAGGKAIAGSGKSVAGSGKSVADSSKAVAGSGLKAAKLLSLSNGKGLIAGAKAEAASSSSAIVTDDSVRACYVSTVQYASAQRVLA